MIHDITPVVSASLAVWPGDTPPRREVLMDVGRGDPLTLSSLHATVHLGAHADAPSHLDPRAPSIDRVPLEPYLGPCEVVRVRPRPGAPLLPGDLPGAPRAERILLATGADPDRERFREDFAALHPDLADFLHDHGVRLVGIDTPSVDPFDSEGLPAHRRLLGHGMAILEGLALEGVSPGRYELVALPLRLAGFEGSPVRAVLRPEGD